MFLLLIHQESSPLLFLTWRNLIFPSNPNCFTKVYILLGFISDGFTVEAKRKDFFQVI
jgi:hypothetical protein